MDNVEKLFDGDKRCGVLTESIIDVIYERGNGLPIPSILGCIELAKMQIINEAVE
jgi:hypothetical protein